MITLNGYIRNMLWLTFHGFHTVIYLIKKREMDLKKEIESLENNNGSIDYSEFHIKKT